MFNFNTKKTVKIPEAAANDFVSESQPLSIPSAISEDEEKEIQQEFENLLEDYRHTRKGDKADLITRVFQFAKNAHGNDRRLSGVPYIKHPLAVARIVAQEIGLGSTSISAALLHDVVKSSHVTFEELEAEFGPRITNLVRGLNKISGGNVRFASVNGSQASITNPEEQAENFRNLLFTFTEDVRVILVKIADRLHNMRTLSALPDFKRRRIASETLYLYAPIADRVGLVKIKGELEELALKYEHPEEYAQLKKNMSEAEANGQLVFKTFAAPVRALLDDLGLEYTFTYRMKSAYSIWRKMRKKHISFDEVYDLFAARIVFTPSKPENEKTDCWRIYAALTTIYRIHPDRIRDWISHPKSSGYEALQVTVMGPDSNWIEVQIRSERMNQEAEEGSAAHWKYKSGGTQNASLSKWMNDIKEILENPAPNATDFLDQINLSVLSESIYVFTKSGDLKELPKESTALDLAFEVHTHVGMNATAARVDHELAPLNTVLETGQQVEIITADEEKITPEWIKWVHTPKAHGKVRQWIKKNHPEIVLDEPVRENEATEKPQKPANKFLQLLHLGGDKKKKKAEKPTGQHSTTIMLHGIDGYGLLNTITKIISEQFTANIINIHLECKDGMFKGYITVNTTDRLMLSQMCGALKSIKEIEKAHIKE